MSLRISLPAILGELQLAVGVLSSVAAVLESSALRCIVAQLSNDDSAVGAARVLPWQLAAKVQGGRSALQSFALRLAVAPACRDASAQLAAGPEHAILARAMKVRLADVTTRLASAAASLRFIEAEVASAGLAEAAGADNRRLDEAASSALARPESSISDFLRAAAAALQTDAAALESSQRELRAAIDGLVYVASSSSLPPPGGDDVHESAIGCAPTLRAALVPSSFPLDQVVSGVYDVISTARKAIAAHPTLFSLRPGEATAAIAAILERGGTPNGRLAVVSSSPREAQGSAGSSLAAAPVRRSFPVVVTASTMTKFR